MYDIGEKPMLRVLMVITDWEQIGNMKKLLRKFPMRFSYITKAEGTANSETLDMFGLGKTEKALTFCILPQVVAEPMMEDLSDTFLLRKRGAGVAFTIPLSGIAANMVKILNDDARERAMNHMNKMEMEAENMKCETSLTLIMTIMNQGFSEDVMEVAKAAGATGGTVIHARRAGNHDHLNFLGVPIQDEQEMLFIVVRREDKKEVMKAINCEFGPRSEAHGVTISLPVDSSAGLEMLMKKR